jgi:hypothetical protein
MKPHTLWLPAAETPAFITADGKGRSFPSYSTRHESPYRGEILIRGASGRFQSYRITRRDGANPERRTR